MDRQREMTGNERENDEEKAMTDLKMMKTSSLASFSGEDNPEEHNAGDEVDSNLWPSLEKRLLAKISELENQVKDKSEQATNFEKLLYNKHQVCIKNLEEIAYAKLEISNLKEKVERTQKENFSYKSKVSELTKKLQDAERENNIHETKFNSIFKERSQLYKKIHQQEQDFIRRGQTDQTIHLNKPKPFRFLNPMEGLGYDNPMYLKRAISLAPPLYDIKFMTNGTAERMAFIRSTYEIEANEEANRKRTDKMQMFFDYSNLNESYLKSKNSFPNDLSDDYIQTPTKEETSYNKHAKVLYYTPTLELENHILELQMLLTVDMVDHQITCSLFNEETQIFDVAKENFQKKCDRFETLAFHLENRNHDL